MTELGQEKMQCETRQARAGRRRQGKIKKFTKNSVGEDRVNVLRS